MYYCCHPATKYNLIIHPHNPPKNFVQGCWNRLVYFLTAMSLSTSPGDPITLITKTMRKVNISNQTSILRHWHYFVLWEYDDLMYFDVSVITTVYFTKETSHLCITPLHITLQKLHPAKWHVSIMSVVFLFII